MGSRNELFLTYKQELSGNSKVGSKLGCSNHRVMEFRILKITAKWLNYFLTFLSVIGLDFRRVDFGISRDMLGRIPCIAFDIYCFD